MAHVCRCLYCRNGLVHPVGNIYIYLGDPRNHYGERDENSMVCRICKMFSSSVVYCDDSVCSICYSLMFDGNRIKTDLEVFKENIAFHESIVERYGGMASDRIIDNLDRMRLLVEDV